jgi:hypothetical protein
MFYTQTDTIPAKRNTETEAPCLVPFVCDDNTRHNSVINSLDRVKGLFLMQIVVPTQPHQQ